jgi:hypothetical protein
MVYTPGPKNAADALSRLCQNQGDKVRHIADDLAFFIAKNAVPKALTIDKVRQKSSEDREVRDIMQKIKIGESLPKEKFRQMESEFTVVDGIVL